MKLLKNNQKIPKKNKKIKKKKKKKKKIKKIQKKKTKKKKKNQLTNSFSYCSSSALYIPSAHPNNQKFGGKSAQQQKRCRDRA